MSNLCFSARSLRSSQTRRLELYLALDAKTISNCEVCVWCRLLNTPSKSYDADLRKVSLLSSLENMYACVACSVLRCIVKT